MGRLVLMSYLRHLGGGVGGTQSIRLGGRRSLPELLVFAVFTNRNTYFVYQESVNILDRVNALTLVAEIAEHLTLWNSIGTR